jgi:hypothetical protein
MLVAIEVGIDLTKLCILPTLIDYGFDVGVEDVVSNKQTNEQTITSFPPSPSWELMTNHIRICNAFGFI